MNQDQSATGSSGPSPSHARESVQDRILDQYHQMMQLNAASSLFRIARQLGILDQLRTGQKTLAQLCESLGLQEDSLTLTMQGLVAIGVIEQYQDDFALSQAAQLLCQYDDDLGDARWQRLADQMRQSDSQKQTDSQEQGDEGGGTVAAKLQRHYDYLAATQWIHTAAAVQAAEMLDIGGHNQTGTSILDLGCGSAVWSCAMAHRDQQATVTAVDTPAALEAATSTADSIGLDDRFQKIVGEPLEVELPGDAFDLVLLAQRLACLADSHAADLIARAVSAARPGGRVVVIDDVAAPGTRTLADSIEALKLQIDTPGRIRTIEEIQQMLQSGGLQHIQFAFLPASKISLGIAVGEKLPG